MSDEYAVDNRTKSQTECQTDLTDKESGYHIGTSGDPEMANEQGADDETKRQTECQSNMTDEGSGSGVGTSEDVDMTHLHTLASREPGQSKVELLAAKIKNRRERRIPVTFRARVDFLKTCRAIAIEKGYEKKTRIHYLDLLEYRRRIKQEVGSNYQPYKELSRLRAYWRIIDDKHCLLDLLNRAVEVVDVIQKKEDEWFHYQVRIAPFEK